MSNYKFKKMSKRKKPSKDFLIWFAGFWEGEGSVWITRCSRQAMSVVQSYKKVESVDEIRKTFIEIENNFGGHFYENKIKDRDYLLARWHIKNRDEIIRVCKWIMPYLKFRKEEVQEKVEFMKNLPKNYYRKSYSREALEKVGK